jgi:hypothetical protein
MPLGGPSVKAAKGEKCVCGHPPSAHGAVAGVLPFDANRDYCRRTLVDVWGMRIKPCPCGHWRTRTA